MSAHADSRSKKLPLVELRPASLANTDTSRNIRFLTPFTKKQPGAEFV